MNRELLRDIKWVAYRGLWDKFAPPNSIAAFTRSLVKKVPFLVNSETCGLTVPEIAAAKIFDRSDVPIFVWGKVGEVLEALSAQADGWSHLFFVDSESTNGGSHRIVKKVCGDFYECGTYFSLANLAGLSNLDRGDVLEDAQDLVLFESVDIHEMPVIEEDDGWATQLLHRRLPNASSLAVVSDLLEGRFLEDQVRQR